MAEEEKKETSSTIGGVEVKVRSIKLDLTVGISMPEGGRKVFESTGEELPVALAGFFGGLGIPLAIPAPQPQPRLTDKTDGQPARDLPPLPPPTSKKTVGDGTRRKASPVNEPPADLKPRKRFLSSSVATNQIPVAEIFSGATLTKLIKQHVTVVGQLHGFEAGELRVRGFSNIECGVIKRECANLQVWVFSTKEVRTLVGRSKLTHQREPRSKKSPASSSSNQRGKQKTDPDPQRFVANCGLELLRPEFCETQTPLLGHPFFIGKKKANAVLESCDDVQYFEQFDGSKFRTVSQIIFKNNARAAREFRDLCEKMGVKLVVSKTGRQRIKTDSLPPPRAPRGPDNPSDDDLKKPPDDDDDDDDDDSSLGGGDDVGRTINTRRRESGKGAPYTLGPDDTFSNIKGLSEQEAETLTGYLGNIPVPVKPVRFSDILVMFDGDREVAWHVYESLRRASFSVVDDSSTCEAEPVKPDESQLHIEIPLPPGSENPFGGGEDQTELPAGFQLPGDS